MRISFFLFTLCLATGLAAQPVTLQVVTKKVEKTFDYHEGVEVNIEGQKANITIDTWEKNFIQVNIAFTAKHPERSIAREDVEKINYLATQAKNKIYIRNYLSSDQAPPTSLLSVEYSILLPQDCPVYLKNEFGIAQLSNLSNKLRINTAFTRIGLEAFKGILDISTRFGDLTGNNLDAQATITSRRSNIKLNNIQGSFNIKAFYGVVEVVAHPNLAFLNIDAEKSNVFTYSANPELIAYKIQANGSNLDLPLALNDKVMDGPQSESFEFLFQPKQNYLSFFQINVSFGDIKIAKARSSAP